MKSSPLCHGLEFRKDDTANVTKEAKKRRSEEANKQTNKRIKQTKEQRNKEANKQKNQTNKESESNCYCVIKVPINATPKKEVTLTDNAKIKIHTAPMT